MDTAGKVALITGGAVRVGKAISLALAESGANIALNYHSSAQAARETQQEIRAIGQECFIYQADVADPRQVEEMVSAVVQALGSLDILVNSASLWQETPFPMKDYRDWERVTGILINGALYCANQAAPHMLAAGQGAIINIVDLSAFEPWPNYIAHAVGKSAQLALSRQLALELAPQVTVNAIAPGPVLPPPDYSQQQIDNIAGKTLLNRWGSPEDIAEAVVFFVRSDYITGEVIRIDGGEHFGHRKAGSA